MSPIHRCRSGSGSSTDRRGSGLSVVFPLSLVNLQHEFVVNAIVLGDQFRETGTGHRTVGRAVPRGTAPCAEVMLPRFVAHALVCEMTRNGAVASRAAEAGCGTPNVVAASIFGVMEFRIANVLDRSQCYPRSWESELQGLGRSECSDREHAAKSLRRQTAEAADFVSIEVLE